MDVRGCVEILAVCLLCLRAFSVAAPSGGEDCHSASAISVPVDGTAGVYAFNNTGAGNSTADSICSVFTSDVWFVTQPVSGQVRVSTCRAWGGDTDVATVVAAYTGCGGQLLACQSWGCGGFQSSIEFTLSSPAPVYIRIAGHLERHSPLVEGAGLFTVIVNSCPTCLSIVDACGPVYDPVCNQTLNCAACLTTSVPSVTTGNYSTTGSGSVFGTWSSPGNGPTVFGHIALADNAHNLIYIQGGFGMTSTSNIAVFDATQETFRELNVTNQPPGRYNHAGVLASGKIIVFGGATYSSAINGAVSHNELDVFDVATASWQPAGTRFPDRYGHSMVLTLDGATAIVFGGIQTTGWASPGMQLDTLEFLDVAALTWTSSDAAGVTGYPPTPRYYHRAVLTEDNLMLVYGGIAFVSYGIDGSANSAVLSDLHVFNVSAKHWWPAGQPQVAGVPPSTFGHSGRVLAFALFCGHPELARSNCAWEAPQPRCAA
eukprot:TRINITY_DN1205_c0_g1_i4.p1 TRINITY_DN1205_c0_g1~~TRINITY_DN1205_c0_g1_i4.p1  ORF type:complete len:487 (-),score=93.64 TRINITY_DN1205_c0_g1_i4:661-2121(-)